MNAKQLASIGIALLLAGGLTGVGAARSLAGPSHANAVGPGREQTAAGGRPVAADGGAALQQGGPPVNASEANVSALAAIGIAQNRTGGKPVVVRLVNANGTPAFNVTLLAENLSVSVVQVDATDRSVVSVQSNVATVQQQFLGGPAFNYSAFRSASDVIRLVRNETNASGANATVINAGIRRGELVYGVSLQSPDGTRTSVLVAGTDSPVLGVRTARPRPPVGNATTAAANSSQ